MRDDVTTIVELLRDVDRASTSVGRAISALRDDGKRSHELLESIASRLARLEADVTNIKTRMIQIEGGQLDLSSFLYAARRTMDPMRSRETVDASLIEGTGAEGGEAPPREGS